MSKTLKLLAATAVAALAFPAAAGSWPNLTRTPAAQPAQASPDGFVTLEGEAMSTLEQYRYFRNEENEKLFTARSIPLVEAPGAATRAVNGFEYVGGEAGWQVAQHKYVWSGGRFAHSDECDHVIRVVSGPTAQDREEAARLYSGG